MRSILPLFFVFILSCSKAQAQIDDPAEAFQAWRVARGEWFMTTDRGDRLEIWEIADDSTYTGAGLRINADNGDTVLLENLRLELREGQIFYRALVPGQNAGSTISFRLTEAWIDEFLFENPQHDDPQKIRYAFLGRREMQVHTEGVQNGRPVSRDFVFEREFVRGSVEARLKGGFNLFALRRTGDFPFSPGPTFAARPAWEAGMQIGLRKASRRVNFTFELGLTGKSSRAQGAFDVQQKTSGGADTVIRYERDVIYRTVWLNAAFLPEASLGKRWVLYAGPYTGRRLSGRAKGQAAPGGESRLFDTNNDLIKSDWGVLAGLEYAWRGGKKDLGIRIGARAQVGMKNVDNLYLRACPDGSCNGRLIFNGVSAYCSFDLLKL